MEWRVPAGLQAAWLTWLLRWSIAGAPEPERQKRSTVSSRPDRLSLPPTWPAIPGANLTSYPCRQPVPLSLRLCHTHLVIAGFLPFAFTLHEFTELIFQRAIFWSTQFPGPITAYSLPMGAFILKPHFLHVCFAAFQCHEMSFIFSKQFHCFLSLFTKVKICSHLTEREGL